MIFAIAVLLILYGLFCIIGDTTRRQLLIDQRVALLFLGKQPTDFIQSSQPPPSVPSQWLHDCAQWVLNGRDAEDEQAIAFSDTPKDEPKKNPLGRPFVWLIGGLVIYLFVGFRRELPNRLGLIFGLLAVGAFFLLLTPLGDWLWKEALGEEAGAVGIRAVIVGCVLSLLTILWNASALNAEWLRVVGFAFRALGLCLFPLLTIWQISIWRKSAWDEKMWLAVERRQQAPPVPEAKASSAPSSPVDPVSPPPPSPPSSEPTPAPITPAITAQATALVDAAASSPTKEAEKNLTAFRQEYPEVANDALDVAISKKFTDEAKVVKPRVYVHVANDRGASMVKNSEKLLRSIGYLVPGVQAVRARAPQITEVRYQASEAESEARNLAKTLSDQIRQPVVVSYVPASAAERRQSRDIASHFEVWFGTSVVK